MRPEGLAVVFLATEGSVSSEFRARMFHEFALNFVAPHGFKFSFDYHIFVCLVAHWRTARKNGKIQERAQETKGQGNCLIRRKGQIKAGTWKEHVIAMSRPRWYWESLTQVELDFSPLACLCLNCLFFQSRWLCTFCVNPLQFCSTLLTGSFQKRRCLVEIWQRTEGVRDCTRTAGEKRSGIENWKEQGKLCLLVFCCYSLYLDVK